MIKAGGRETGRRVRMYRITITVTYAMCLLSQISTGIRIAGMNMLGANS